MNTNMETPSSSSACSPQPNFTIQKHGKFTVCTYNVLAQALVSREYFPWTAPSALKWAARQKLFEEQITTLAQKCDIFCFQEMDIIKYHDFWDLFLHSLGFASYFSSKEGQNAKHGLCIAYNFKKFVKITQHTIQFDRLKAISRDPLESNEITQANLGQIVVLLPISTLYTNQDSVDNKTKRLPLLFILNNHLHWRYYFNYTKFRQLLLLRFATIILKSYVPTSITINNPEKLNQLIEQTLCTPQIIVDNVQNNDTQSCDNQSSPNSLSQPTHISAIMTNNNQPIDPATSIDSPSLPIVATQLTPIIASPAEQQPQTDQSTEQPALSAAAIARKEQQLLKQQQRQQQRAQQQKFDQNNNKNKPKKIVFDPKAELCFTQALVDDNLITFNYKPSIKSSPFVKSSNLTPISSFGSMVQNGNDNTTIPLENNIISCGDFNLTTATSCLPFHQTHLWPVVLPCYPNHGKMKEMTLSFEHLNPISPIESNSPSSPVTKSSHRNGIVRDKNGNVVEMKVLASRSEMYEKEDYLKLTQHQFLIQPSFTESPTLIQMSFDRDQFNKNNDTNNNVKLDVVESANTSQQHQQQHVNCPYDLVNQNHQINAPLSLEETDAYHITTTPIIHLTSTTMNRGHDQDNIIVQLNNIQDDNNVGNNDDASHPTTTQPQSTNPLSVGALHSPQSSPLLSSPQPPSLSSLSSSLSTSSISKLNLSGDIYQQIDVLFQHLREKTLFSPYSALHTPLHSLVFLIQLAMMNTYYEYIPIQYFATETQYQTNLFPLLSPSSSWGQTVHTNNQTVLSPSNQLTSHQSDIGHNNNNSNNTTLLNENILLPTRSDHHRHQPSQPHQQESITTTSSNPNTPVLSPTTFLPHTSLLNHPSLTLYKSNHTANSISNGSITSTVKGSVRHYIPKNHEKLKIHFQFSSISEDIVNTFPKYLVDSIQYWFSSKYGFIDYVDELDKIDPGLVVGLDCNGAWVNSSQANQAQKDIITKSTRNNDNKDTSLISLHQIETAQSVPTWTEFLQKQYKRHEVRSHKLRNAPKPVQIGNNDTNSQSTTTEQNNNKKKNNNNKKPAKKETIVEEIQQHQALQLEVDRFTLDHLYQQNTDKLVKFKELLCWMIDAYDFLGLSMNNVCYPQDILSTLPQQQKQQQQQQQQHKNIKNTTSPITTTTSVINPNLMLTGGPDLIKSLLMHKDVNEYMTFNQQCEEKVEEFVKKFDFFFCVQTIPSFPFSTNNSPQNHFTALPTTVYPTALSTTEKPLLKFPISHSISGEPLPLPRTILFPKNNNNNNNNNNSENNNNNGENQSSENNPFQLELFLDQTTLLPKPVRIRVNYDLTSTSLTLKMIQQSIYAYVLNFAIVFGGVNNLGQNELSNGMEPKLNLDNVSNTIFPSNLLQPQYTCDIKIIHNDKQVSTMADQDNNTIVDDDDPKEQFINMTQSFLQRLADILILSLPTIEPFLPLIKPTSTSDNDPERMVYTNIVEMLSQFDMFPQLYSAYGKYPFLPNPSDYLSRQSLQPKKVLTQPMLKNQNVLSPFTFDVKECFHKQYNLMMSKLISTSLLVSSSSSPIINNNTTTMSNDELLNSIDGNTKKSYPLKLQACQICLPTITSFLSSSSSSSSNSPNISHSLDSIFTLNNMCCPCESYNKGIPFSNHRTGWCGVLDHILVSYNQPQEQQQGPDQQSNNNYLQCREIRTTEHRALMGIEESVPNTTFPSDHLPLASTFDL